MYGVDTFLTISGFLVSYSFLKKYTPTQGKLNLDIYYLHRYIRYDLIISIFHLIDGETGDFIYQI